MARCNCANPTGVDQPILTGCGLTGDGTAERPLTTVTEQWTFPGPESSAGGVFCVNGVLRSDPAVYQQHNATSAAGSPGTILGGTVVLISQLSLTLSNPDVNRQASGLLIEQFWVRSNMPVGSIVQFFNGTGEILGDHNTGSAANNNWSSGFTQSTRFTIAAGGSVTATSSLAGAGVSNPTVRNFRHGLLMYSWTNPTAVGM